MAKLMFNAEEVRKLVAHSKGREHPDKNYGQKLDPTQYKEFLYLVHDQGVYLMSGAKENLKRLDKPESSVVSYAKGCHPDTDEEWYEEARYLVGGDDFGEPIPLDMFEMGLEMVDKVGAKTLTVNFGKTKIGIALPKKGR